MEGSVTELSRYRFETSLEALADARLMYENGRYKNALNRGYYAIFHAIRAVEEERAEAKKQEKKALETELSSLKGLFTGKLRREIEARLAQIKEELGKLN